MRSEIKVPINENFIFQFDNWKNFENKISRPYEDRQVNSVYFDDEEYVTAHDNLAGISNRRKYRIRWYGDETKNFSYEIKIKKNNLGKKIILKSENESTKLENLFSFKNDFFKKDKNKFFLNYIENLNLKPKMQISYLRSYFLYEGKVRITYDQKIEYSLANQFEINKSKFKDTMNVVEIKFDPKDFNLALELINDSKFLPKRFSKYLRGLYLSGLANYI